MTSANGSIPDTLKIAVLSDLHFFDPADKARHAGIQWSHLPLSTASLGNVLESPLLSLHQLIETESLTADAIVCPGDITTRADRAAFAYGWQQLHDIKQRMMARSLVVATGNHEVDSRMTAGLGQYDTIEHLKSIVPSYPMDSEAARDTYFGFGVAEVVLGDARLVSLNSCLAHGTGMATEYERGRVSDSTLARLDQLLTAGGRKSINVLVTHHHPHPHAELQLGAADLMLQGQQLLLLLEKHGSWLVVHGHKHHGKISYAAGAGSVAPVVFAAGSFSACLDPALATQTKNQFYVVELKKHPQLGTLVGTMRCWSWFFQLGWRPSIQTDHGILDKSAFGSRVMPALLANRIVPNVGATPIQWTTLFSTLPELEHITPSDRGLILKHLREDHNVRIVQTPGCIELGTTP